MASSKKVVIRVYFIDEASKAFALDRHDTAKTLSEILISNIGIVQHQYLALFERKFEWERCLEPDDRPVELAENWEDKTQCKFLYKKKVFLRTDEDKEMEDLVAKDLIYKQAHNCIINSDYPCEVPNALYLAGLQMQIVYGDYNICIHVQGFLTTNDSLKNFVPKNLYPTKKPNEWEALILKQHSISRPISHEDAKKKYIDQVRAFEHYGTTFFPLCKSVNNRSLPNKVIIGVNYEGIKNFKTRSKDQCISKHLFTDIYSWSSSATTFAFEYGTQYESTKYTFETKHGSIIASTIQTYIDLLVQLLKNGDSDEEESETVSSEK